MPERAFAAVGPRSRTPRFQPLDRRRSASSCALDYIALWISDRRTLRKTASGAVHFMRLHQFQRTPITSSRRGTSTVVAVRRRARRSTQGVRVDVRLRQPRQGCPDSCASSSSTVRQGPADRAKRVRANPEMKSRAGKCVERGSKTLGSRPRIEDRAVLALCIPARTGRTIVPRAIRSTSRGLSPTPSIGASRPNPPNPIRGTSASQLQPAAGRPRAPGKSAAADAGAMARKRENRVNAPPGAPSSVRRRGPPCSRSPRPSRPGGK